MSCGDLSGLGSCRKFRSVHGVLLAAIGLALLAGCSGSTAVTTSPPPPTAPPASATAQSQQSGFVPTGSMTDDRGGAAAVLLQDGRVLIAGGERYAEESGATMRYELATAELYDPATGKFTATGSMSVPRSHLTATLLSSGHVLITGGYNTPAGDEMGGPAPLDTAEVYDPATGEFTPTGSMAVARDGHTATLMPDGRVLVSGGNTDAPLTSTELYDPALDKFTPVDSMTVARADHAAAILETDWVVVTGGISGDNRTPVDSTEGYAATGSEWQALGSMTTARAGHTATYMGSIANVGEVVLICGGMDGSGAFLASCERLDMTPGSFTSVGKMTASRYDGAAVLLRDGRVLILGGTVDTDDHATSTADLYSATAGLSSAGSMHAARAGATATLLKDGSVLIAGGYDSNKTLSSAELFKP